MTDDHAQATDEGSEENKGTTEPVSDANDSDRGPDAPTPAPADDADADVVAEVVEDDLPADLDVVPDIHDLLPDSDPIGVVPGTADERVDNPSAEPTAD